MMIRKKTRETVLQLYHNSTPPTCAQYVQIYDVFSHNLKNNKLPVYTLPSDIPKIPFSIDNRFSDEHKCNEIFQRLSRNIPRYPRHREEGSLSGRMGLRTLLSLSGGSRQNQVLQ